MKEETLLTKPAYQLAQLVRTGEISSRELVDLAIAKVKTENSQLNAVIKLREDKARQEADQLVDRGQPFLGVPLLIKGLGQQLAGEPDTNGNRLFKNNIAQSTNNFVKALQAAGFIIIGQTNFPEFGWKNITDADIYGPAHNPWNTDYTPGGSSGGSAAAVAAGWVPLAAGNDGGGSIRIPSSWSGLIGLKPTRGRVPTGPSDWRSWQGASINFALTRSVDDAALLLDHLQTVQSAAVFQVPKVHPGFHAALREPVAKLKIGYTTKSPVGTPVSEEAKQAVNDAVRFLTAQGFICEEYDDPIDGVELMNSYYTMNAGETDAMFKSIEGAIKRPVTRHDMELLSYALWQTGKNISAADYSLALSSWDRAGYLHDQLHDTYPLFLTPTNAQPAPRVDDDPVKPVYRKQMEHITELSPKEQQQLIYDQWLPALTYTPFTEQANMTGEPAISLPTHVCRNHTPLGIQFIARKGNEALLLQMAKLFESHHQFKMLHETNFED